MGVVTGVVKGSELKKNKDGENLVLMLQVEITDPDDVQSVQLMTQSGEDTNPEDGANVTVVSISEAFKLAIASDDGVEPSMGKGEKKIYSVLNKAVSAFINFLSGGNLELNGNADFAVRYNALETRIKELETNHNEHIHTTTATIGATASPGVISIPTIPSDVDFSSAKVETVKIA